MFDHLLLAHVEAGCDLLHLIWKQIALIVRGDLVLDPPQVEEELPLIGGRAYPHQRP